MFGRQSPRISSVVGCPTGSNGWILRLSYVRIPAKKGR